MLETVRPNVFSNSPQLEAIMPFPTPEITPGPKVLATDSRSSNTTTFEERGFWTRSDGISLTSGNQNVLHDVQRYLKGKRPNCLWLANAREGEKKRVNTKGFGPCEEKKNEIAAFGGRCSGRI